MSVPDPPTIPLVRPELGEAEGRAVAEVLRSGWLAMGPVTERLERAWADACGVRHAVFMANGSLALEALLRSLGIGPGDEVITVSFSFNATASAILRNGARPVFVDVREDDFCIDPELVETAVTPRTRAILPVHLFGLMADMPRLRAIAERRDLVIVEDAAQAIGAACGPLRPGQSGPAMFSLYATKTVTSGEGGMIATDDGVLDDRLRMERDHGRRRGYVHERLATNLRPTDLSAAIGLAQLSSLPERIERQRRNAARLRAGLEGYLVPATPDGRTHAWHQYTVRFPGERDRVAAGLAGRGVGTKVYYPVPIHRQPYLLELMPHLRDLTLPVTERLATEVLSLPVRASLTDRELDHVIGSVREVASPATGPAATPAAATGQA